MTKYRKLIVGVIGIVVLLGLNVGGVELGPEVGTAAVSLVDAVIALLTVFGIERLPNEPSKA